MKRIISLILLGFLILPLAASAQLQPFGPGVKISNLPGLITNIVNAVWVVFTVIVVVMFVVAGVLFLTSHGEPAKLQQAKAAFIWGVAGVAVGIVAFSIIYLVGHVIAFGN